MVSSGTGSSGTGSGGTGSGGTGSGSTGSGGTGSGSTGSRTESNAPTEYPILPLKNSVIFPSVVSPLTAGRSRSLAAIEAALNHEDSAIVVLAQKQPQVEDPGETDLYTIGTKAVIRKVVKSERSIDLMVHGL